MRGDAPDLEAPAVSTPHPLPIAGSALLSLAGPRAAADAYAFGAALAFLVLLYAAFRLGRALAGAPAGVVAAVLAAASSRLDFFASRSFVDVPFATLVLLAAALAAERPRRNGTRILLLLAAAGLLRPEAWGLSILYAAWLLLDRHKRGGAPRRAPLAAGPPAAPVRRHRGASRPAPPAAGPPAASGHPDRGAPRPARLAILALAAPVLWIAFDLALTGNPLHSLRGTQAGAIELERATGLSDLLPSLRAGLDGLIGLLPAAAGALVAGWALLRRRAGADASAGPRSRWARAFQPLARPAGPRRGPVLVAASLAAAGVAAFCVLAVADLPLNDRYLIVPALALLVLAAAAVPHVPRSPVAAVAAALALVPIGLGLPGDLAAAREAVRGASERSNADTDLEALLARPAVRERIAACPRLLAAGSARAPAAALLDRDPSEIAVARSPLPPRGAATLSTSDTVAPGTPGTVREGAWTFVTRC